MNRNLLIIGAGGHGRVVEETSDAMGYFGKINFLDDSSEVAIGMCNEYKQYIDEYKYAFVAFGNNELRMNWIKDLVEAGFKLPILKHPTAYVSPSAKISEGTIVSAKAVINTNAEIEKGCIVSIGALVEHDSFIGACTHINTGAIVKAGCKVDKLVKIDAGVVYSGNEN